MAIDFRISIAEILLTHPEGLTSNQIRAGLESIYESPFNSGEVCTLLNRMHDLHQISRRTVKSVHRHYIYFIGTVPVWGVYDKYRMNLEKVTILILAQKELDRRDIARILLEKNVPTCYTYKWILQMEDNGWVKVYKCDVRLTRLGRIILEDNRRIIAHNVEGMQREFRSLTAGQIEGISAGGIPS